MSANIVNVVHKEGRQQAGSKQAACSSGHTLCQLFVRHAACNMLALILATEQQQQQQQEIVTADPSERRRRIVQGPRKQQPPLSLWRHLNELQINFILVACASLRMEMMMDNNDATTGSPTPRALRRLRRRLRLRLRLRRRLNSFPSLARPLSFSHSLNSE